MRPASVALIVVVMCAGGCSSKKSALLLERPARGPLTEARQVGQRFEWRLEPVRQTQTQHGIDVVANHASREFLDNFFKQRELFGEYAGRNPYYLENLVFFVEIANRSDKKIFVDPGVFALVDDRGNQYSVIGLDYVTALGEARAPFAVATRGILEEARPGYFGVSLPLGKMVSAKPQGQFALIKQSAIHGGY